jgi:hypothetical protein
MNAISKSFAPPPILAPTDHGPDAELIRNSAKLVEMEAEWRAGGDGGNCPDRPDGYYELIDAVTASSALTEEGNRAKLAVVVSFHEPDFDESSIVCRMMWDAVRALATVSHPEPVARDGALMKLCQQFHAARAACNAAPEDDEPCIDRLCKRECDLWKRVLATPAHTAAGVRAKASVLQARTFHAQTDSYEAMVASLLRDIGAASGHEDRDLLQLCAKFHDVQRAAEDLNAVMAASPKDDPRSKINEKQMGLINDRWSDLLEAITAQPAVTFGGMQAKAGVLRVALEIEVAPFNDETVEEDGDDHDKLAISLVRDLLGPLEGKPRRKRRARRAGRQAEVTVSAL